MADKPFKFRNEATAVLYVDSWAYGTRDGMFYFALGIKDDVDGNTGHLNGAFLMTAASARMMHKQLTDLLDPNRKPDPVIKKFAPEEKKNRKIF